MALTVEIFRGDGLLCDVLMIYVNASHETQKPMPVPEPFIETILAFEKTSPERK